MLRKEIRELKKKKYKKIIGMFLFVITLLSAGTIFYNSKQNKNDSNAQSYVVAKKLRSYLISKEIIIENGNNYTHKINYDKYKNNSLILKLKDNDYFNNITLLSLNKVIRKCAHILEYAVLDIIICILLYCFDVKKIDIMFYSLFIVLFTGVLDEAVQMKSEGRNSSVIDVLFDFSGGVLVNFVLFGTYYVLGKVKKAGGRGSCCTK